MRETFFSGLNLGVKSRKYNITVSLNKKNTRLCEYLFEIGLLDSFFIDKKNKKITFFFSYFYDKKVIRQLTKISNPGRNRYMTYLQLKKLLLSRNNLVILSTSKGIMTNKEAITKKVGGELLFFIKC